MVKMSLVFIPTIKTEQTCPIAINQRSFKFVSIDTPRIICIYSREPVPQSKKIYSHRVDEKKASHTVDQHQEAVPLALEGRRIHLVRHLEVRSHRSPKLEMERHNRLEHQEAGGMKFHRGRCSRLLEEDNLSQDPLEEARILRYRTISLII